jgi:hypothetical protein
MTRIAHRLVGRLTTLTAPGERERGDVPGWVLVTLMTAGLVILLWGLARTTLAELFENAVRGVAGSIGG